MKVLSSNVLTLFHPSLLHTQLLPSLLHTQLLPSLLHTQPLPSLLRTFPPSYTPSPSPPSHPSPPIPSLLPPYPDTMISPLGLQAHVNTSDSCPLSTVTLLGGRSVEGGVAAAEK